MKITVRHIPVVRPVTTDIELDPESIASLCSDEYAMNSAIGACQADDMAFALVKQTVEIELLRVIGSPQKLPTGTGADFPDGRFAKLRYEVSSLIIKRGVQKLNDGRRPAFAHIKD